MLIKSIARYIGLAITIIILFSHSNRNAEGHEVYAGNESKLIALAN